MELIVINENKLKIMMSAPDMQKYGLDENEFHLSIMDTRKFLDKVIHNSPIKTGFETISPDERILMQLYPEKNGGCELFVTRIPLCNEEDWTPMAQENDEQLFLPRAKIKHIQAKRPTISYSFAEFDFVVRAARELYSRRFSGESSLYRENTGKYYLFTRERKNDDEDGTTSAKNVTTLCLSEFGELENAENAYLHLLEHGKCIIEQNAVKTLAEI